MVAGMIMNFRKVGMIISIIFSVVIINGCNELLRSIDWEDMATKDLNERHEVSGKGTMTQKYNCYVIICDDGKQYAPTNLSDEFIVINLRVEFCGMAQKTPNQNGIYELELSYIKGIS